MTVNNWLSSSEQSLKQAGISTARLDCLILIEDATGKDRGWLLAHPEFELTTRQVKNLDNQIQRRASHEPLAYIRGKTEFYSREFYINHRVLEPRPESETMIELLKLLNLSKNLKIIDVGTGSGALAITAKLELSGSNVIATDIDPGCLEVARKNAKQHGVNIKLLEGNLLEPVNQATQSGSVLLCNLPYVPDDFQINPAAMREPKLAIFGGRDGLDLYSQLFKQIQCNQQKPLYILTESLPPQHVKLEKIAIAAGFKLTETDDFIQLFERV